MVELRTHLKLFQKVDNWMNKVSLIEERNSYSSIFDTMTESAQYVNKLPNCHMGLCDANSC